MSLRTGNPVSIIIQLNSSGPASLLVHRGRRYPENIIFAWVNKAGVRDLSVGIGSTADHWKVSVQEADRILHCEEVRLGGLAGVVVVGEVQGLGRVQPDTVAINSTHDEQRDGLGAVVLGGKF